MSVRIGCYCASLVVLWPGEPRAQVSDVVFQETFDDYAGQLNASRKQFGTLDSEIWSFSPADARGFLLLDFSKPVSVEAIEGLLPGAYAVRDPDGTSLALKPKDGAIEADVTIDLPQGAARHGGQPPGRRDLQQAGRQSLGGDLRQGGLPARGSARPRRPEDPADESPSFFVTFRASTPSLLADYRASATKKTSPAPPSKARKPITLTFLWSVDGKEYRQEPEASVTFDARADFRLIVPHVEIKTGGGSQLHLRWRVNGGPDALVFLDNIAVLSRERQALVLAHVDARDDDKRLLKETLRTALSLRGMSIVTCREDIEEQVAIIGDLASRQFTRRDDAPSTSKILESMTRAGCRAPLGASLWVAWLTAHEDQRTRSREVVLRLRNLDDFMGSPTLHVVAEPARSRWSWSALVDRAVLKSKDIDPTPTILMPTRIHIRAGRRAQLRPTIPEGFDADWSVYWCATREECDLLQSEINEYTHCLQVNISWHYWESGSKSKCYSPLALDTAIFNRRVEEVSDTGAVNIDKAQSSLQADIPGHYVIVGTLVYENEQNLPRFVGQEGELPLASSRLDVEPRRHSIRVPMGASFNPGGIAFGIQYDLELFRTDIPPNPWSLRFSVGAETLFAQSLETFYAGVVAALVSASGGTENVQLRISAGPAWDFIRHDRGFPLKLIDESIIGFAGKWEWGAGLSMNNQWNAQAYEGLDDLQVVAYGFGGARW